MRKWYKFAPVLLVVFALLVIVASTSFASIESVDNDTEIALDGTLHDAYVAFEDAIANKRTTVFIFADISQKDIIHVFEMVTLDHPEFMSIKKNFSILSIGWFKRVTFSYDKTIDEQRALDVAETMAARTTDLSEVEKVAYIYTALTRHVEYSANNFADSTAYGALVNMKASCEGYSEAMSLMLSAAGIENNLVSGVVNGTRHRWVRADIAGVWYEFDPTFDAGKNEWEYFMVSKAH